MITTNWFFYALVSLSFYGLWGLFSKLATNYLGSKTVLIYDLIGAVLVGLVFLATNGWEWRGDMRGVIFAMLTGAVGTIATLCYFIAVSKGSSSIVLPLTSMYPAVTVILAFFILKEPLTLRHTVGIFLAILAIIFCSEE
jgi:transporter family protein